MPGPRGSGGAPSQATKFDIRTWAKSDGRWVADAAMASSSGTITSASAAFTAADVGKLVALATQPGSGTATSFAGTVATVVSATQITVTGFTNTTGGAISGAFLALGSDETAAFQAALDAELSAGGGLCYVPDGIYLIGTDPTTGHGQIEVGVVATTAQPCSIGFVGQTPPQQVRWNLGTSPPSMGCPVLLSLQGALTSRKTGSIIGAQTATNVLLRLQNLALRTLPGVSDGSSGIGPGGLNLNKVNNCDLHDVTVEVQSSINMLPTPANYAVGIQMPGLDNGAFCRANQCQVVGFGVGWYLCEHADIDHVSAYACQSGYKTLNMNHAARAGRLGAYWTANAVQPDQGSAGHQYLTIGQLAIEDASAGSWYSPVAHLDDPLNLLRGEVSFLRVVAFVGDSAGWTQNGGAGVRATDLYRAQVSPDKLTGLAAWWRADAGVLDASDAPITADGTAIKTWQDQSGNARHLTQATSGKRPLWKASVRGFNDRPAVRFDGVDDFLANAALAIASGSTFTMFVVAYRDQAISTEGTMFDVRGGTSFILTNDIGSRNALIYAGSGFDASPYTVDPAGTWIYSATQDGAESVIYEDNRRRRRRASPQSGTLTSATVGASDGTGTPAKFFPGDIAEVILYTAVLSGAERSGVYRYLANKYGLLQAA